MLLETRNVGLFYLALLTALSSAATPEVAFQTPSRLGIIHESYPGYADADWFDTAYPAVQAGAVLQINMTSTKLPPVGTSPGTPFWFIPALSKYIGLASNSVIQYGHLAAASNQALHLTATPSLITDSLYSTPTLQKAYVLDDSTQIQQFWAFNTTSLELKYIGKAYNGPTTDPVPAVNDYGAVQPASFPAKLQLGPVKIAPGKLYLRPILVVDPPPPTVKPSATLS